MRALQGQGRSGACSSALQRGSQQSSSGLPHRHHLPPSPSSGCQQQRLASRQPLSLRAANGDGDAPSAQAQQPAVVDFDELSDIIRTVNSTDIIELELNSKKFNLSLKKKEAVLMEQQQQQMQHQMQFGPPAAFSPMPPPQAAPTPPPAPTASTPPPNPEPAPMTPGPQKIEGIEITSPMSGTFYSAPAPGEPPFCKEGDKVTKGQTVGIIEAMKLMNEIEAEVSGTVVKVLAENGKPVSPGVPLILVKP